MIDKSDRVKRYRIEIKVSEEQKELIVRAAASSGHGISEFVRLAAERAARDQSKLQTDAKHI